MSSRKTSKKSQRKPPAYEDFKRIALIAGAAGGILLLIGGVSNFNILEFFGIDEAQLVRMATDSFGSAGGDLVTAGLLALRILSVVGGFLVLGGVFLVKKDRPLAAGVLMNLGVGLGLVGFFILLFIVVTSVVESLRTSIVLITLAGTFFTIVSLVEVKLMRKEMKKEKAK